MYIKDGMDKSYGPFCLSIRGIIQRQLKEDVEDLSPGAFFGAYEHPEDSEALVSISTFGFDDNFEIDVYYPFTCTQTVYDADEVEDAIAEFMEAISAQMSTK